MKRSSRNSTLFWKYWGTGILIAACLGPAPTNVALGAESLSGSAKTLLETDPQGWTDVMPGADLKGWQRVAIAPDTTLKPKNAWRVDTASGTLQCDGVGVKEMLLYDRELGDGVFHLEWRFHPVGGDVDYNSGAYVRSSGSLWHQIQIAHTFKSPYVGDVFGDRPVPGGKPERWVVSGTGRSLTQPPGEWNVMEIRCRGKEIIVAINGLEATRFAGCDAPRGRIGLQAEYYQIEFRNLKFKDQ